MTGSVTRSRLNTSLTRRRATASMLDRPGASGDGGHDRDLVRLLELDVEAVAEPDVLIVQIDVHELAGLAVGVEQPVLEARVATVQRVDGPAQVLSVDVDGRGALAQAPERAGDAELRALGDLRQLKH